MTQFKFKVSLRQQLAVLAPSILINLLGLVLFLSTSWTRKDDSVIITIILGFYIVIFTFIPMMLHVQYLLRNCSSPLIIDLKTRVLATGKGDRLNIYGLDEVVSVTYYSTFSHHSGEVSRFVFDTYRYYKITFKDGFYLVITSLMINDIEHVIEGVFSAKTVKKVRIIPLIY